MKRHEEDGSNSLCVRQGAVLFLVVTSSYTEIVLQPKSKAETNFLRGYIGFYLFFG